MILTYKNTTKVRGIDHQKHKLVLEKLLGKFMEGRYRPPET